jgi:hypothetical protein
LRLGCRTFSCSSSPSVFAAIDAAWALVAKLPSFARQDVRNCFLGLWNAGM